VPQANYRTPQTIINLQREKLQRKNTGYPAFGTLVRNRSACELGSPVNKGTSLKMEDVGAPNRVFECGSNNKANSLVGNGFHRRARSQDFDKVMADVHMRE
jgi:hypothetical protein